MYSSMEEVRAANEAAGQHWFDPDTMAWWRSTVDSGLIGGRWFVSSEQQDGYERRWTVRRANDDGTVSTEGDMSQYEDCLSAVRAATGLAVEAAGFAC